jgi:tetratricopeptide (TPR) repeat protein
MKQWMIGVAVAAAVSAAPRPVSAQVRGWVPNDCPLSTGHYLVNSAVLYLKNAAMTRFQDQRERDLRDARRVLLQAAQQGQGDNPAVWYFLGRYYGEVNDLAGMDSAFDRASAAAPQCAADIRAHRRRLWVPILNSAVDRIRAGDQDAAKAELYRSFGVFDGEPQAFYYLAQIYAQRDQRDSATMYFKRAIAVAQDSANRSNEQAQKLLRDATFNIASTFHMDKQYDSAAAWYRRYREQRPDDAQAMTRLADALDQGGHSAEALALYDSVLARADSMPTLDLFQAGVAMFDGKRFDAAAQAFEAGLRRNPQYRDALFNLANTYLSMANLSDSGQGPDVARIKKELGEKMMPIVNRLVEVDPMSEPARRLRAAAFQLQGLGDSTVAVLQALQTLPFDVTVSAFTPSGSGYDVRGIITNRQDSTATTPPFVFEFLNGAGEVVQAITVDPKPVDGASIVPFAMAPVGEGIVAWRYRPES